MGIAAEGTTPAVGGVPTTSPTAGRDPTIDAFRGLAVLLMALGNFELGVRIFPAAVKHTVGVGYTVADLVAPMFVVAIALTVGPSMRRRREVDGTAAAYRHLATRGLALVGIGAVISAGQATVNPVPGVSGSWGVLQALGGATLLLLPVVFTPPLVRVLSGLLCLASYQWFFDHGWSTTVLHTSHNGLPGAVSWAALLMLTTAVVDAGRRVNDPSRRLELTAVTGGAAVVAALVLACWVDVSKDAASPTYMLLSLGLSLLVLTATGALMGGHPARWFPIQRVGRNPLLLYMANLLLLGVLQLPGVDWWYAGASLWLSLVQACAIAAITIGLATALDRRGIIVTL
jgi:predicted acyltransferase